MAFTLVACLVPACLTSPLQEVSEAAGMAAEATRAVTTWLPIVDWFAIAAVLIGLTAGALAGLARAFSMLLWMLAALWLANHLSAQVVSWLPNSAEPGDPTLRLTAFGVITALVLTLPVLGRVLGGAGGKKKATGEPQHKPFGALIGLFIACLFVTLMLPFVRELPYLGEHWDEARAPALAGGLADNMTYLYPIEHRETLR